MTWVKLDDGFIRNRKIRNLSHRGVVLHIAGLCHCAAQLTDGRIDKADVPMLLADARVGRAALTDLVEHGCWHDHGDHYLIHDYLEYQESRERVLERRDKWAKKKADARMSNGDSTVDSIGESQGVSATPVPSRPVPSPRSSSPTGHHHQHGSPAEDDDGRFAQVIQALADERIRKRPAKTNPLAYRTTVVDSLVREHGDTIRSFLAARPEHPADVCAAALALDIA